MTCELVVYMLAAATTVNPVAFQHPKREHSGSRQMGQTARQVSELGLGKKVELEDFSDADGSKHISGVSGSLAVPANLTDIHSNCSQQ